MLSLFLGSPTAPDGLYSIIDLGLGQNCATHGPSVVIGIYAGQGSIEQASKLSVTEMFPTLGILDHSRP